MKRRTEYILAGLALLVVGAAIFLFFQGPSAQQEQASAENPLAGKQFYVDETRKVTQQATKYRNDGRTADADQLDKIARQPGTTWLNGPNPGDPQANFDIAEVTRTSSAAAAQNKVAVYQLYAIPKRDACAGYSAAGFDTRDEYIQWINRIVGALRGDAVFSVEADAIAQAVEGNCLSEQEKKDRYALISEALYQMKGKKHVVATYLDAGHAEWLPDANEIVGPLKQAGVDNANGIAVNVSAFVDTEKITNWSANLAKELGPTAGVLVDTSRNGQGTPPSDVTGEGRWCNPKGRGIGPVPTTNTGKDRIDAYAYIKIVGESDGDCFGNPPAGTFVPGLALELARNAKQ